jgi:hypothetical protein
MRTSNPAKKLRDMPKAVHLMLMLIVTINTRWVTSFVVYDLPYSLKHSVNTCGHVPVPYVFIYPL